MRRIALLALVLVALVPPAAAVQTPDCDPGTFDPVPPQAVLCQEDHTVGASVDALGVGAEVVVIRCLSCGGTNATDAGAALGVDDSRGNLVPEGWMLVRTWHRESPGTFDEPERCVELRGMVAWGPFWQEFGDDPCVAGLP